MTTANPTTSTTGSESCNAMTGVGNTSDTRLTSNGNDSLQSLKTRATAAISVVRPFLARAQLNTMAAGCRGEEKEYFMQLFIDLSVRITAMPKTYEQDGLMMQAVVHLHYFLGGSDWYITEKDVDGGVRQAFGYVVLNGDEDCSELGYLSIEEITRNGAELNLHFQPCTLTMLLSRRAQSEVPAGN